MTAFAMVREVGSYGEDALTARRPLVSCEMLRQAQHDRPGRGRRKDTGGTPVQFGDGIRGRDARATIWAERRGRLGQPALPTIGFGMQRRVVRLPGRRLVQLGSRAHWRPE